MRLTGELTGNLTFAAREPMCRAREPMRPAREPMCRAREPMRRAREPMRLSHEPRRFACLILTTLLTASCGVLPGAGIFSGRAPAPIAERDIDLVGRCMQIEDDGFRERADLVVRDNRVEALSWEIAVGRRGSCRFEHAEFEQTKRRPHIELSARDRSGCRLLIWQDPRRITLAHAGCSNRCAPGGVHEEAWPVMFDPHTGGCAAKL